MGAGDHSTGHIRRFRSRCEGDGAGVPAGNLAVPCFEAPALRTLRSTAVSLAGLGYLFSGALSDRKVKNLQDLMMVVSIVGLSVTGSPSKMVKVTPNASTVLCKFLEVSRHYVRTVDVAASSRI